MSLSVSEFVKRWKLNALKESSAAQPHFIDLCEMLGEPHPAASDAVGERYTFEKSVSKVYGGKGSADVWLRDHFAWEYKGKDKDLKTAYKQINNYREDLGNPPLLVVCDLNHFEVHTNFTSTSKRVYAFDLSDLERNQVTASCPMPPLEVLRALFTNVDALRPNRTDAFVTLEAAKVFARLAERLEIEKRSLTDTPIHTKEEIAHFLMRLLFCLFADSVGLLPKQVFRRLIQSDDRFLPKRFLRKLRDLFDAMSNDDRDNDTFGEHTIKYFTEASSTPPLSSSSTPPTSAFSTKPLVTTGHTSLRKSLALSSSGPSTPNAAPSSAHTTPPQKTSSSSSSPSSCGPSNAAGTKSNPTYSSSSALTFQASPKGRAKLD